MTSNSVTDFPSARTAAQDMLIGPCEVFYVQIEGRMIPRLTAFHEGEKIGLVVDGRFSASFSPDDAYQAANLIAQAMAVTAGYAHLGAEQQGGPFAPRVTFLGGVK